ncbi:hypothetical protein D3C81_1942760 [compost metagenome]
MWKSPILLDIDLCQIPIPARAPRRSLFPTTGLLFQCYTDVNGASPECKLCKTTVLSSGLHKPVPKRHKR